ncbi:MAG: hypothetical protein ABEJ22_02715 [Haloferacaceae archaeon]
MCHYYESTEEWQALWLARAECEEEREVPGSERDADAAVEDADADPGTRSVDV